MVNVQARVRSDDDSYEWDDYGKVTQVAAAKSHAYRYPFKASEIETRYEGHKMIYRHRVEKEIRYRVTPFRGD